MLQSFLQTAIRSFTKRKGYSLLNLLGLTIGIACCLMIFEYVAYERSYEAFNPLADRIVRVQDAEYEQGKLVVPCASAMPPIAPTMRREFPEVEAAGRLFHSHLILANDNRELRFRESNIFYADPEIPRLFALHLLEGDAQTALAAPGKILLSQTEARKYFGSEDALGKTLTTPDRGGSRPLEVTGVFADYPPNSHLHFDILVSYKTFSQINGTYGQPHDPTETSWGWTDFYTYVLVRKGADMRQLQTKVSAMIDSYFNNLPENQANKDRFELSLMPLRDIHLYSHFTEEIEANGDGQSVAFLFLIAIFIIAIAWINYINLATARSLDRAKEVGVRKVLGATRTELIRQFLLESLLLNGAALALAIGAVLIANPLFAHLTGRPLNAVFTLPARYWEYFAALFLAGTFGSGLYPALVLSRYRPVTVLKGIFRNAAGGQRLRQALIVGQFAASIILIAGTIIVYRQVTYMRHERLGADIDQTLIVKGGGSGLTDSAYTTSFDAFKQAALHVKGVNSITASSNIMGEEILWSTDWYRIGNPDGKKPIEIFMLGVDDDFIPAYGIRMAAGRNFSPGFPSDRRSVLLNETAVRSLGFSSPQAAIGQLVGSGWNGTDSMQVVGVVADYHNEGLQKAIQPLVFLPGINNRSDYSLKVTASDAPATIAGIKKIWDRYFPGSPYSYFFLDEFFNRQYAENQRFGNVFALFAALAVAIACFGLLGLSAYNVLQRTKEIGIRKVLGAPVGSLLVLLSRDFLALVALAFAVSIPVTWWAMDSWLQAFAYRIRIGWWTFAVAGILALSIALLTVGLQALKAALANPVKSLRTE